MSHKKRVQYEWSIAIYQGDSPDQMSPVEGISLPAITAADVTDVDAAFTADPFMLQKEGKWYLFYEVWNQNNGLGELACSSSRDLKTWSFEGMVMQEGFHLSYPMVFSHEGRYYMVPETRQAGEIRLFEATDFPLQWKQVAKLASGDYADATPFQYQRRWWMFAVHGVSTLHLFYAEDLKGPWTLHPKSPLVEENLRISRPAGRVLQHQGKLYRLAQDGIPLYGSRVRMLEITHLTTTEYQEQEIENSPILKASRRGWNSIAMHHMDAQQLPNGQWIACVDGATPRFNFAENKGTTTVYQPVQSSGASKGKICFVAGEFYPTIGGLSKSATRIARVLAKDGYEVHVVVPTSGSPQMALPKAQEYEGMQVYRIPIGEDVRNSGGIPLTAAVWQLDQQLHFDLFHGFFLPMAYVCLMALKNIKRPLIVSVRGNDALIWTQPKTLDITHKILEYTTCITSVNTALLDQVLSAASYTGWQKVVKNSIPKYQGAAWELSDRNRGVVGTIGKFQVKKEIPVLVEAYAQLPRTNRKCLKITGGYIDEGLEQQVQDAIVKNELQEEVSLKGFVKASEVHEEMATFHCFVLTSNSEGFPNVVLEAAAQGLPLVVTEFPGIEAYLQNEVNALTVPVGDPQAIAEAIQRILMDDALAIRLSKGARKWASEMSPENEAKEWLELHQALLENVSEPV